MPNSGITTDEWESAFRQAETEGVRDDGPDGVTSFELQRQTGLCQTAVMRRIQRMIDSGKAPDVIIREKNLAQISDTQALDKIVEEVIKENPKSVGDYAKGKENAVMFLVGQVMRKSKGKANPKGVLEIIKKRLK